MNKLYYPGENPRVFRKAPNGAVSDSSGIRKNIPGNWIYDEKKAKEFWEESDVEIASKREEIANKGENYQRFDESTMRIRQLISDFEVQDQELMFKLIEMAADDAPSANIDQENILFEARSRLAQILEEHSDIAERQSKLLDSLKYWFELLKKGKNDLDSSLLTQQDMGMFDIVALSALVESLNKSKEQSAEMVSEYHHGIVQSLEKKVQECEKVISIKDNTLASIEFNAERRKKRRPEHRDKDFSQEKELEMAYKKISELQKLVNQLRSDKVSIEQKSTTPEIHEKDDEVLDLEKEIEFEAQILMVNEQSKKIKEECKDLHNQISKMRQNDLIKEKKLQLLERTKGSLERTIQSMQDRIDYLEQMNSKKTETRIINDEPSFNGFGDVVEKYEMQIKQLKELNEKRVLENEKKLKIQIEKFASAFESGDKDNSIRNTIALYEEKINTIQKRDSKVLNEEIKNSSKRYSDMVNHYERILKEEEKRVKVQMEKVNDEIHFKIKAKQIEIDEMMNQQYLDIISQKDEALSQMRFEFIKKIDDLKKNLSKAIRERDSLLAVLDSHSISPILNEDEEIPVVDEGNDDIIFQSLKEINRLEIEKNISEKYSLLLTTQKSLQNETKNWEIAQTSKVTRDSMISVFSSFRSELVLTLKSFFSRPTNNGTEFENIHHSLLHCIDKYLPYTQKAESYQMIPISEVDSRFDEMKHKLMELLAENEIWKLALDQIDSFKGKSENEIFDALKHAIFLQASKNAELMKQNDILEKELRKSLIIQNQLKKAVEMNLDQVDGDSIAQIFNHVSRIPDLNFFNCSIVSIDNSKSFLCSPIEDGIISTDNMINIEYSNSNCNGLYISGSLSVSLLYVTNEKNVINPSSIVFSLPLPINYDTDTINKISSDFQSLKMELSNMKTKFDFLKLSSQRICVELSKHILSFIKNNLVSNDQSLMWESLDCVVTSLVDVGFLEESDISGPLQLLVMKMNHFSKDKAMGIDEASKNIFAVLSKISGDADKSMESSLIHSTQIFNNSNKHIISHLVIFIKYLKKFLVDIVDRIMNYSREIEKMKKIVVDKKRIQMANNSNIENRKSKSIVDYNQDSDEIDRSDMLGQLFCLQDQLLEQKNYISNLEFKNEKMKNDILFLSRPKNNCFSLSNLSVLFQSFPIQSSISSVTTPNSKVSNKRFDTPKEKTKEHRDLVFGKGIESPKSPKLHVPRSSPKSPVIMRNEFTPFSNTSCIVLESFDKTPLSENDSSAVIMVTNISSTSTPKNNRSRPHSPKNVSSSISKTIHSNIENYISELQKRIQKLELKYQDKISKVHIEEEKNSKIQKKLVVQQIDIKKAERQCLKENMSHKRTKDKLAKSIQVIIEKERTIEMLQNKLSKYTQRTQLSSRTINSINDQLSLEITPKTINEAEHLNSVSPRRQSQWELMKSQVIREEKERLMKYLKAMCFVKE